MPKSSIREKDEIWKWRVASMLSTSVKGVTKFLVHVATTFTCKQGNPDMIAVLKKCLARKQDRSKKKNKNSAD